MSNDGAVEDLRRRIRELEEAQAAQTVIEFTHGLCPECIKEWFPGLPEQKAP